MDTYQIAVIVMGLVSMIGVPAVKNLYSRMTATENNLAAYKLHVAEKYVDKVHLDEHVKRIEKGIDEIKVMIRENQN